MARLPRPADRRHQQLGSPVALFRDNLNAHKASGLREFAEARDRLTLSSASRFPRRDHRRPT